MTKLAFDVAKLKTAIRQNADLDEWCKIMDDQFDVVDAAVQAKLNK